MIVTYTPDGVQMTDLERSAQQLYRSKTRIELCYLHHQRYYTWPSVLDSGLEIARRIARFDVDAMKEV